jgi:hypothetical protein
MRNKKMKKILGLCLTLAVLSIVSLANGAPPKATPKPKANKSIETTLLVRIDRNAKEAKLIIPKGQLKQLRAQLDDLDDSLDTTASLSFTKTQTIVSGLFFSLAFVFGGVWLARTGKIDTKAGKILVIGSVLFLSGAVATIVYANAGPPPEARTLTNKFFSQGVNSYKFGSGKIKLEVSETAQSPELIVPDVPDEKKPNSEK